MDADRLIIIILKSYCVIDVILRTQIYEYFFWWRCVSIRIEIIFFIVILVIGRPMTPLG